MTTSLAAVAGALASSSFRRLSSLESDSNPTNNPDSSNDNNNNNKHVGIVAMQVYTPCTYVQQSHLEEYSGVDAGRYTIGLGQQGLAVTGDAEDVNSLALTVVHSLLEDYQIDVSEIGRVEVGTESLIDKSKSTKTVLMDLFSGQTDIEGATVVNACYGGTAALWNAVHWCESDGWNHKYALVVAADIATYARGPARPTSGVGAVAVLVGRDAPLVLGERATHASNVWDFYKPNPAVEYPVVDGALSQECYYRALHDVYTRLCDTLETKTGKTANVNSHDYYCFHAPYNKLVQKSFARLFFIDAQRKYHKQQRGSEEEKKEDKKDEDTHALLQEWISLPLEQTTTDKRLEQVLKQVSQDAFAKKLADANYASQLIGNTYTASVFFGLASLVDRVVSLTHGTTIALFSYGSGALATLYRIHVRQPTNPRFTLDKMRDVLNLTQRLANRLLVHASELDHALETRARMHCAGAPYSPVYPNLQPGTYYLQGMDAQWRRTYKRVPREQTLPTTEKEFFELAPPIVLRLARQEALSTPVTGKLLNTVQRIACVITGTAAGLPGKERVFDASNLQTLLEGHNCITPISGSTKMALLEKNVVQIHKHKDGSVQKIAVDSQDEVIKLAAQLGDIDLTASYGVPAGLAETMDVAAQVAVAAGMEALKSAKLVTGRTADPHEWMLPEQYRDTTGVVYASSFPAMDAAVGEVMRFLQSKTVGAADSMRLVSALRNRVIRASPDRQLSDDDEAAFARLLSRAKETLDDPVLQDYVFDRKFLFRVLVLGNAQLAQLAGCRGPNTQTNAACAGTTQAIGMAQDMLISGRAERVVVIAGDNASGSTLLPWLGSGFRALGAATTQAAVEDAACPFDKRRSGMLLGAGAIGMVLETEASCLERQISGSVEIKARLLATQYSNSAFHGAALDRNHIAAELKRFLADVELIHGICKAEIATHGVYFSHETCTHATDSSSCSGNEVGALRMAFGDELLSKLLILNTKGFTGHPMGVSFEDVTAVEVLLHQRVPAVPNYKVKDDYLGDLNLSKGGPYACRYALRFAAGFGSQVAFALYATAKYE